MPSVCFYFQVHQPFRLKNYSYFQITKDNQYFDTDKNRQIMQKVANKCYLPTNRTILDLINKHQGNFRVAYSITGVAIEQMQAYCPEALQSFIDLAQTGCVEFIAETYYHSLAAVYDKEEFAKQVKLQVELTQEIFKQTPQIFRNTELIYSDTIGKIVHDLGFKAIICEGADDILGWRSPNFLYAHPECDLPLLLKNYRLSDDIAFRFSNQGWPEYPLTADKFAKWVHEISGNGEVLNLFMDYETFGEHQWESTGIFEFLKHLPEKILQHTDWNFKTPSQVIDTYKPVAALSYPRTTSWADIDRDLTAWQGNQMQKSALQQIYSLAQSVYQTNCIETIGNWRKLLTSDHYYYMCTKWFGDGDVHAYFSPYESPYDAFINFMNVLKDFSYRLENNSNQSQLLG